MGDRRTRVDIWGVVSRWAERLWVFLMTQTVPAWVLFGACAITIAICYCFGWFGRRR